MMIRKLWSKLAILVVAISIFSACKDQKQTDYTNMIPADAKWVTSINVKSLYNKTGATAEDKAKIANALKSEVSSEMYNLLEQFIDDPSASGIDISAPLYIFLEEIDGSSASGAVMKIANADKLYKVCQTLQEEGIFSEIRKEGNLYIVDEICMFDEFKLIVGNIQINDEDKLKKLFNQTAEESIASTANFALFKEKAKDISFLINAEELLSKSREFIPGTMTPDMDKMDISDFFYITALSFDKGALNLTFDITANDKAALAEATEQQKMFNFTKHKFVSFYPKSTLMYGSFNVDSKALLNYIEKQRMLQDKLGDEEIVILNNIAEAAKGDICYGFTDFSMASLDATMYAEVDKNAAKQLYENYASSHKGVQKISEGVYKQRIIYASEIYFGYKDDYAFLATSTSAFEAVGKKQSSSLSDAEYASNMKGKKAYMVLDVQNVLNNDMLKMLIGFGGREARMYANICSNISHIEAFSEDGSSATISMQFMEKDKNALQQIISIAQQYAGY